MSSFRDIINRWATAEQFAEDLGIPGVTARQWRRRNNIPANHWRGVVNAARVRGFTDVTEIALTDMATHQTDQATVSTKLILVRHGQSHWNLDNRFTGWVDVDLSPTGLAEARAAGQALAAEGISLDLAFTSVLKRAIRTLWVIMDELDQMWVPVERSWRLNERHYGGLQGLNKAETAAEYGDDQVKIWRRSYATPPPLLDWDDPAHPRFERRYTGVPAAELPDAESLALTLDRVLPYWNNRIAPEVAKGRTVMIAAHGNSLRALVKHLEGISDEAILELNIPTGIPLIYELDAGLAVQSSRYLADDDAVRAAADAEANQDRG